MEGDVKARGSKTLPVIIGKERAVLAAIAFYLLFIPLTALPFFFGLKTDVIAIALVIIADLIILILCFKLFSHKYKFARNASLIAFFIGMIGILLAAI
jgi:4-hydroxybenzoate polyprenyltransferase